MPILCMPRVPQIAGQEALCGQRDGGSASLQHPGACDRALGQRRGTRKPVEPEWALVRTHAVMPARQDRRWRTSVGGGCRRGGAPPPLTLPPPA